MSAATQTVQIISRDKWVDVEGRIIAPGLAITPNSDDGTRFSISHLPSGKSLMQSRCAEHIEEAARLLTGHPKPIDWTRPEEAIVGDEALKDLVVSISEAVGRCYDCGPKYDGPTWSVRCTTCDWQWEDEYNEGPLDVEAARDMARDHECEPNVEMLPPGDGAKWVPEWRVSSDGTVRSAR
ncbi:hypothetical protein AB0I37_25110 [Micromonospora purpureochromogenes]|uniref:hypothetical protein n=1 Tax=Micromonospora purpureochromogenes TaxID=47872 RepID=UPI0033E04F87